MSDIDHFYIKGVRKKKKEPPKNKRRKFPAPKQNDQETRVTDHCIVQYMQRVLEIDVEQLRESIFKSAQPAIEMGSCSLVEGDTKFIIEGGCVVTCYLVNETKAEERRF